MLPLSSLLLLLLYQVINCAEFHTNEGNKVNNSEEVNNLVSSETPTSDPVSSNRITVTENFDMLTLDTRNMRRCPYSGAIIPDNQVVAVKSNPGKCPFNHVKTDTMPATLIEAEGTKGEAVEETGNIKEKKHKKKSKKKNYKKNKKSKQSSSDDSSSSGTSLFSSSSSSSSTSSSSSSSTSSSSSSTDFNKEIFKKMKNNMPKDHGNGSDFTQCPYYKAYLAKKKSKK